MAKDGDNFATTRRKVLFGAGGLLATAQLPAAHAVEIGREQVTDAPVSDKTQQRQPFHGLHQPGIVTPRPAAGMVAAFHVLAKSPTEVERLFRLLTERIAFLMQGGAPPQLDDKLPPADSGLLGPDIPPDNLTMTVSLGASFFEQRSWLAAHRPVQLSRMAASPNDALDADLCHGDLLLQISSNTPDTNIHALRDILKNLPDLMVLRWKQEGSVPVLPPKPDGSHETARNFLGFRDGTANPDANDKALMDRIVWVTAESGEPQWAVAGSYQVVRIIRNFVERWDRTPLGEQERIIGRRKASGAPFGGKVEADLPDYAGDPEGTITPLDAHIRLANKRSKGSDANLILRRPFNYSNGVSKSGQLEQGLLFICYQADLEKGFITVQRQLDGEPLEEYIKPIGGGFFYALPGARDERDFLGRTLLEAAGHQMAGTRT
ncbi:iron uptake transporter deferrochelatase/peroxidase subunit [Phyllobacterium sp. 21LDTY02-6]|uniref:iron uptake transporter deferrochelatase/peroxidase subunit n=1 Tax=Phyllobacterium sp. 21LDTY02-6 TaxID=2944903 RepID=UPI00202202F1|nr:iron uptake transporter deferrochelatase/peroxidase subunit [Phyllobacterium sp. 21LDTY02-6]MCO4317994.1 iron uptake transporter deferrochelatase/peroxidase subunit [Phyllobacterium sp. 21LDTY02-6]